MGFREVVEVFGRLYGLDGFLHCSGFADEPSEGVEVEFFRRDCVHVAEFGRFQGVVDVFLLDRELDVRVEVKLPRVERPIFRQVSLLAVRRVLLLVAEADFAQLLLLRRLDELLVVVEDLLQFVHPELRLVSFQA